LPHSDSCNADAKAARVIEKREILNKIKHSSQLRDFSPSLGIRLVTQFLHQGGKNLPTAADRL
jgi:hypothetical protein